MPGRGVAPKANRRNKADVPIRGEWAASPGVGWQHGPIPAPPDGLLIASRTAWRTWMQAWFAANWGPDDLPSLRQLVKLYDQVERGEYTRSTELRLQEDTYGITPKGQQDRRWTKPAETTAPGPTPESKSRYAGLRVVSE